MASRGLGTLTLDLVAKTGAFTGPLDKAARDADRSFRRITDSASKFGKALGTGIGLAAVAATTALIGITKAAIDNADAIRDLSIRTGIGTETLSAYGYAASQTGTSIEALGKGLNILAKNAAAALNPTSAQAKIFDALGISVTDATGNLKDMDALLPEIATRFKNLEDGTTKTALVLKLFGRAGAELTEFLNQGGEGLDEFTAKARELGLVVDQDTADAADKFKDTLGEVKATVGGLGLSIARELLPALQEGAEDFKRLVQEGDLAHNMVTLLSAAVSLGVGAIDAYGNAVKRTGVIMDFMVQAGQGWQESVRNIWAPWSDGTVANGIAKMKQAIAEGDKALADINNPKKNPFANVRGGASTVDPNARATDARALALALSNPRAPKSGGKKGKSDAEREAEQLLKAYQRMEASYREQIALVGDVTEVERLRYELANGEDGKRFTETQKSTLLALAAEKDAVDAAHKQMEESKALTESLLTPFEQVNKYREEAKKLLDAGAISQETYNRALAAQLTPAEEVNAAILEQIELLGMSIEQQEIYNNLKSAGVDANSAWGQSIIANTELLEQARDQAEWLDDVKEGLSDMFVDFVSGAKTAKEAFGDFADAIYKRALQFVADKAIQALFDAFSGKQQSGGSTQGSGWQNLFTSLLGSFGGGKASGGMVAANSFYRIAEQGPEVLSMNGSDYLITGKHGGMVTPNHALGGGMNQVNNFQFVGRVDRRTQDQVEATLAQRSRRAVARNS